MADSGLNLTPYDQVLVNALMSLVLPIIARPEDQKMQLEIIQRVLPHVNRAHHYIEPLADWAESLIAAERGRGSTWHRATFQINEALAAFTSWRLGLLLDNMRAAKGAAKQTGKEVA